MNKIVITKDSLYLTKGIMSQIEGGSFHDHIHILHDIRTSMGKNPVTYLEIGAYAGASACLMSGHPYPTNVFSVDIGDPIQPHVVESNVERYRNPKSTFKYIHGNSQSQQIIDTVKAFVPQVDILFIDGDHTENGVRLDFTNYYPLVKEGGYIVFDDYQDNEHSPEVKIMVDQIAGQAPKEFFEIIGSLDYPYSGMSNIPQKTKMNEFIIRRRVGSDQSNTEIVFSDKQLIENVSKAPKQKSNTTGKKPSTQQDTTPTNEFQDDQLGFPLFVLEKKLENLLQKEDSDENRKKRKQLERSISILSTIKNEMA